MSKHQSPAPHHVYDEEINLESFSVSREMGSIAALVVYVNDVTPIPREGQIAEFRLLGTRVQGLVNYASLMSVRDETFLHIQATRIQE